VDIHNYQKYSSLLNINNQRFNAFSRVSLNTMNLVFLSKQDSELNRQKVLFYKDSMLNATKNLLDYNTLLTCIIQFLYTT
jgi:hypothetical protein